MMLLSLFFFRYNKFNIFWNKSLKFGVASEHDADHSLSSQDNVTYHRINLIPNEIIRFINKN